MGCILHIDAKQLRMNADEWENRNEDDIHGRQFIRYGPDLRKATEVYDGRGWDRGHDGWAGFQRYSTLWSLWGRVLCKW